MIARDRRVGVEVAEPARQHPDLPGSGSGSPVLELEGVTKTYAAQPPVPALRGVSLQVRSGEMVAIVGPSGSGKTTLLHIMGTLDRATTGTVRLTGMDVATMSDRELSALRAIRIGFVFQQFFLAEHATVLDNVADGLLYSGIAMRERRDRVSEALRLVGIPNRSTARPTQLSGGQRQRVAIARALVGEPAILLADEPTGNLDHTTGQSILDLLDELHARGMTIVVITHDRDIAARAPRRVDMLDGRIVGDGTRDVADAEPHRPAQGVASVNASDRDVVPGPHPAEDKEE